MWLAGIPVADRAVLHLAASLREAELVDTAERLERAYDREARIVALDVPDREAILRVLEECPEEAAWSCGRRCMQEHVMARARRALAAPAVGSADASSRQRRALRCDDPPRAWRRPENGMAKSPVMAFRFRLMSQADAEAIARWHYPDPFSFYDWTSDPDDLAELLDPTARGDDYVAVEDETDKPDRILPLQTAARREAPRSASASIPN